MSVYIPGMEMPKACIACPFAQYWSEPTKFADDALFEKVLLICWRTRSKIQNGANRNDDCPLIPVPEQKWIPVTERLPQERTEVLIYDPFYGDPVIAVAYLDSGGSWFWRDDMGTSATPNPTHWMPLPQPPKEETE